MSDALQYKGVVDCSTNPDYPAADAGDVHKVSVAGKIGGASGPSVEVGDMLICTTDATATGNHATVGAYWNILQTNIDGAVSGPASSTDNAITRFDSTTGKVLQNSLVTIDDSGAINVPSGQDYKIDSTSVLNASTLGSGVTSSSLTSVGTLSSGNATAIVDAASDTAAGKVELATETETKARTDSARAVTPADLASFLNRYVGTFSSSQGQTIALATHGITEPLNVFVQQDDGTNHINVEVAWHIVQSTKAVVWSADATAFNGRVIIVGV